MKNAILLLLFTLCSADTIAQNETHKQVVDTFLKQLNDNNFEGIYQSFSPRMQQSRTKKYFFKFFSKVKREHGNLLFLELDQYRENSENSTRGVYNGQFDTGRLRIWFSVDKHGKIMGLYLKKDPLL